MLLRRIWDDKIISRLGIINPVGGHGDYNYTADYALWHQPLTKLLKVLPDLFENYNEAKERLFKQILSGNTRNVYKYRKLEKWSDLMRRYRNLDIELRGLSKGRLSLGLYRTGRFAHNSPLNDSSFTVREEEN